MTCCCACLRRGCWSTCSSARITSRLLRLSSRSAPLCEHCSSATVARHQRAAILENIPNITPSASSAAVLVKADFLPKIYLTI